MIKTICIDIDGVTANIGEEICYRLRQDGLAASPDDFNVYKIEDLFPVDKGWLASNFSDPTFWLNAVPYEDAWHMINKWFSAGIDIFFVTGRWHDAEEPTLRWLNEWDIPFNNAYFAQDHEEKWRVVQKLSSSYMIEDRLTEANALVANGITTFLMDRLWNQGDTKAIRVRDFYEIDRRLQNAD